VVIDDSRKRPWSFRLVQHCVKCDIPTRKRDGIFRGQNKGRKQQREEDQETMSSHLFIDSSSTIAQNERVDT
jgi:hypothetical protein